MSAGKIELGLAHSPDPDDAFMWWPITGKITPDGVAVAGQSTPRLDTGRFSFRAIPADIQQLNRRAALTGDLDITALSFRAYCDVRDRYAITHCGSSFGDGFGPRIVAPPGLAERIVQAGAPVALSNLKIAIPGRQTTAFLLLCMALKVPPKDVHNARFVEMPFDQIIGAVARKHVDAGLVIHEGQLLFQDAGLVLGLDLGAWWKQQTGLPVPLGCNAVRRDLDKRFGPGTQKTVVALLRASIEYALVNRQESLEYTMPFAMANAAKKGAEQSGTPTLDRIDRYVHMYVNSYTVDMGAQGKQAVQKLLSFGTSAGLCPDCGEIDIQ